MSFSSSFLFRKSISSTKTPVKISLEDIQFSLESVIDVQGSATVDSPVYVDHVQYLLKKVSCLKDYEKQERLEKEEAEYELQRKTEKIQDLKEKNRRLKRQIADLEQQQQLSSKRQRVATLMSSNGLIRGIQISDPDF